MSYNRHELYSDRQRTTNDSEYKRVNYLDIKSVSSGMHFLREVLNSERIGVAIARCEPGWQSKPYDHWENEHERFGLHQMRRIRFGMEYEKVPSYS